MIWKRGTLGSGRGGGGKFEAELECNISALRFILPS